MQVTCHAPENDQIRSRSRLALFRVVPALVAVVLLIAVALVAWYELGHDGRVYAGVSVLGKDLGGLNREEAAAAITAASAGYPGGSVTADGAGGHWTFTAADLGVGVDVPKTVEQALSAGRSGNLLDNLFTQVGLLLRGDIVTPEPAS